MKEGSLIESLSHITFIVKNLDKTSYFFKSCLMQKKFIIVGKNFSLFKERFFISGNQWIVIMEDANILNKTYHRIAFKISTSNIDSYINKTKNLN